MGEGGKIYKKKKKEKKKGRKVVGSERYCIWAFTSREMGW